LVDINLKIGGPCKVALVGRTGSGKTTLVSAIIRFFDIRSGSIRVNGKSVTDVPIELLRRKIHFVTQDQSSTLFGETLRKVLDPKDECSDREIISTLTKVGFRFKQDQSLSSGLLDQPFDSNSISVGEKQLLVCARAILIGGRILILDEAMSALDKEREKKAHEAILSTYKENIILSVAHRISSILNYDRVLVLGGGRIVEDGVPRELLKDQETEFSKLFRAGLENGTEDLTNGS